MSRTKPPGLSSASADTCSCSHKSGFSRSSHLPPGTQRPSAAPGCPPAPTPAAGLERAGVRQDDSWPPWLRWLFQIGRQPLWASEVPLGRAPQGALRLQKGQGAWPPILSLRVAVAGWAGGAWVQGRLSSFPLWDPGP